MKAVSSRACVSLFFPDDIKTFPALALDTCGGPCFRVPEQSLALMESALKIVVEYSDEDGRKRCAAEAVSSDGRNIFFRLLGTPEAPEAAPYHSVDYKGSFTVASVASGDEIKFAAMAERINSTEKNDLSSKIREAAASGSDGTEILGFLVEINSKIDRILSILTPAPAVPGSFNVRGVSVSGGGFLFYSERPFHTERIFATALFEGAGVRIRFACLCSLKNVARGIWSAGFIDLDETVRDGIVRFVFAREREILKEARL